MVYKIVPIALSVLLIGCAMQPPQVVIEMPAVNVSVVVDEKDPEIIYEDVCTFEDEEIQEEKPEPKVETKTIVKKEIVICGEEETEAILLMPKFDVARFQNNQNGFNTYAVNYGQAINVLKENLRKSFESCLKERHAAR